VVIAAWALVLVVLAFATHGRPTVAVQQSPAGARGDVDDTAARVLSAADGVAVAAVGDYDQARRCDLSVDRDGVDYRRTIDLYGAAGDLLQSVTDRLPTSYKAKLAPTLDSSAPVTEAHPTPFLKLTISAAVGDPGHLTAVIDTGCRPTTGNPYPQFLAPPTAAERAPVAAAFRRLHVTPQTWQRSSVRCTATVTATGHADISLSPLGTVLDAHPLPGTPISRGDTRYVYRGATDLVVSTDGDLLTVSATTGCR
jgi:hypothetical protein